MAKTAPQIIKASWFSPMALMQVADKNPFKKTDFVKQGYKPTANDASGILTIFEDMPLAYYDIPTSNKQLFMKPLWESLASDPDLNFRMKECRSFWGEPFHADSLEILLPQVSHKVLDFHVSDSGLIKGNVAVLDTPNGNIIYSLSKDGWVGISSRGFGSLEDSDDGVNQIVSAADYIHVSWDFVGVPAVRDAMATVSNHLKNSKIIEPILQSLKAMVGSNPDLKALETLLQSDSRKFSVTMPRGMTPIESAAKIATGVANEEHVEEREDGSFWIVGPTDADGKQTGVPLEQGPYSTVDEAAANLLMVWLQTAGHEVDTSADLFESYIAERGTTYDFAVQASLRRDGKVEIVDDLIVSGKATEPRIFEGADALPYILVDDKKFGPYKSAADAEDIMKTSIQLQNAAASRPIKSADDVLPKPADGTPITSADGTLIKSVEDTPFEDEIVPGDEGLEGVDGIDDAEAADRAEFSEMVLLELAEALESTDDEMVDDYDDMPEDLDIEPIEESAKPIKSAEGDEEIPPLPEEGGDDEFGGDMGEDDLYFPSEDDGQVSLDDTSGTITISTTSGDGEPLTVEITLEDGYLTEVGGEITDEDGDGEEGENNSLLPGGTEDLFETTNGDVSAAVDYILGLPNAVGSDATVIDLTEGEGEEDGSMDLGPIEQAKKAGKPAKKAEKDAKPTKKEPKKFGKDEKAKK